MSNKTYYKDDSYEDIIARGDVFVIESLIQKAVLKYPHGEEDITLYEVKENTYVLKNIKFISKNYSNSPAELVIYTDKEVLEFKNIIIKSKISVNSPKKKREKIIPKKKDKNVIRKKRKLSIPTSHVVFSEPDNKSFAIPTIFQPETINPFLPFVQTNDVFFKPSNSDTETDDEFDIDFNKDFIGSLKKSKSDIIFLKALTAKVKDPEIQNILLDFLKNIKKTHKAIDNLLLFTDNLLLLTR